MATGMATAVSASMVAEISVCTAAATRDDYRKGDRDHCLYGGGDHCRNEFRYGGRDD